MHMPGLHQGQRGDQAVVRRSVATAPSQLASAVVSGDDPAIDASRR